MTDDLDDLSVLGRRGMLSVAEQRRLQALLASSPEALLVHRAGSEFDRADIVLPGDDQLAERIAQGVLARLPSAPARRPRRVLLLALAATLAASAALAATLGAIAWREPARTPTPATPRRAPRVEVAPLATPVVTPLPLDKPAPPRPSARVTHAVGPAELFAAASRARREGQPQHALKLYGELEQRFAKTPEAHAAHMALGLLLLDSAPETALGHFEAYLHAAPSSDLRAEALWGQSRALLALGRSSHARAVLQELLAEAPHSAYAPAARAKLASLPEP